MVSGELSPKLLVKANAPLPPTVFFTTVMDPTGALVKVQVVVAPAVTTMAVGVPLVQVAGGAVVCALGWKLLADSPKPGEVTLDPVHAKAIAMGRAFAPLTMPMTIDAGVISVAITVGANHARSFKHALIQVLASVTGAGIIALSILLSYRYAQRAGKRIGHTAMMVVVRLSAFIMLCIGVGISWNGIKALLAEIGIPAASP